MRVENMLADLMAKEDMKGEYSLEHAVGTVDFRIEITKITDFDGKVIHEKRTLAEIRFNDAADA